MLFVPEKWRGMARVTEEYSIVVNECYFDERAYRMYCLIMLN